MLWRSAIPFPDFFERDIMRTFRGGLLIGLAVAVLVAALAVTYEMYDTRTLKRTVRRGEVLCGVNKGLPGFSIPDAKGNWTGFDQDDDGGGTWDLEQARTHNQANEISDLSGAS